MSTLKSILHHWDSSSSSYDTLHPETEKAQVTDWAQGIVDTLASTALGSLISTLSSDSLMAQLVKLVLNATGVKYLMGTNGYICFGSLFGGLIIQWGKFNTGTGTSKGKITLPLSASIILITLQHYGRSAQYNGVDDSGSVTSSLSDAEEVGFIVISQ